ncbi:radical SAM protein [Helicobacter sp. 23-1044]
MDCHDLPLANLAMTENSALDSANQTKNAESTQTSIKVINKDFVLTNKKLPTRRGVIWLGQTCNLNCYFCYFAEKIADKSHPQHPFFTIEKAKEICRIFKDEYGLNSIDIQGGEPTIYPQIFELLKYCNEIDLKPTLITNLIALANFEYAKKFKDAGIYDFLVSLQGIGETYNKVVGKNNAFEKQIAALENLARLEIPIRVNAVLSNEIISELPQIVDLAIKYNARVVNFLSYNNTGDQKILRDREKIPYYDIIATKLAPQIQRLESLNIEVNVRFLPFCVMDEKYRKNIQNGEQMIYDIHEWEASSRLWIDRNNQREAKAEIEKRRTIYYLSRFKISKIYRSKSLSEKMRWLRRLIMPFLPQARHYEEILPYQKPILNKLRFYTPNAKFRPKLSKIEHFYIEQKEVMRDIVPSKIYHKKCESCDLSEICDGFYVDFIDEFGSNAIKAIKIDSAKNSVDSTKNDKDSAKNSTDSAKNAAGGGRKVLDSAFYTKNQFKVIEKQEWDWYFNESERKFIAEQLNAKSK